MDIKDFLPELRKMIQGPLQLVMADELFSSAIIFCKESKVVREVITLGDVVKGVEVDVTVTMPSVTPWAMARVYNDDGNLDRGIDYIQNSKDKIIFLDDIKGVRIVPWLIPNDSQDIPVILNDFKEEIAHGAAAKLYLQTNQSWTDGNQSAYHNRLFVEGFRKAWRMVLEQYGNYYNPKIKNSYWM